MNSRNLQIAAVLAVTLPVSLGTGAMPALAAEAERDPATLVPVEEIEAPIIDSGRLDGVLKIKVTLQTRTPDGAEELADMMPELRAALLAGTMEFARLRASPYTPVDVAGLRAILTPAVRKIAPQVDTVLVLKAGAFTS
ncbi:hypothetical protein HT136_19575 [Novosphingobium profundi]|uniref:hypothetical protein n=1 Tax=Novosphingobium profundi TaxID=1774954 RepID=UPI001BDA7F6B|nr:hypothetical protein [Novosphingobium profundi]MBT0670572.1 hypothetical protein [Novosphingobium profundi]